MKVVNRWLVLAVLVLALVVYAAIAVAQDFLGGAPPKPPAADAGFAEKIMYYAFMAAFLLGFLERARAAWNAKKGESKAEAALGALAIGVEAAKKVLPQASQDALVDKLREAATRTGMRPILHAAYMVAKESGIVLETRERAIVDPEGNVVVLPPAANAPPELEPLRPPPPVMRPQPPKLPALLALVLALPLLAGASVGCVSQRIHESALRLEASYATLRAATEEPEPRKEYSDKASPHYDPEAPAKVRELEAEVRRAIKIMQEASKP